MRDVCREIYVRDVNHLLVLRALNGSCRGDGCVNILERRSSIARLHTVALRIEPSNCIAHLIPRCAVLRKKSALTSAVIDTRNSLVFLRHNEPRQGWSRLTSKTTRREQTFRPFDRLGRRNGKNTRNRYLCSIPKNSLTQERVLTMEWCVAGWSYCHSQEV